MADTVRATKYTYEEGMTQADKKKYRRQQRAIVRAALKAKMAEDVTQAEDDAEELEVAPPVRTKKTKKGKKAKVA